MRTVIQISMSTVILNVLHAVALAKLVLEEQPINVSHVQLIDTCIMEDAYLAVRVPISNSISQG